MPSPTRATSSSEQAPPRSVRPSRRGRSRPPLWRVATTAVPWEVGGQSQPTPALGHAHPAPTVDESSYWRLFSHSLSPLAIAGFDGFFKELNPAWTSVVSHSVEELRGHPFVQFIHPEDVAATQRAMDSLARQPGSSVAFGNRFRCKTGDYRRLEWAAHGDPDQPLIYCVVQDVTEREQQRRLLQRSERLLKQTGALANVGGWEIDVGDMVPRWSDEVCGIHEVPAGHVPTLEEAINFYAPEARPVVQQAVGEAIESGGGWDLELPFVTAKGNRIWVRALGTTILEQGKTVRLIGAFQDINQRKLNEIRLEKTAVALRRLHEITAEPLPFDVKVNQILQLGVETFGLQLGIVSEIIDRDYFVRFSASVGDAVEPGTRFDVQNTYCCHVLAANAPVGYHEVGKSEIAGHPCYETFQLESYLGTPIIADGERFGTLNFSAQVEREPFVDGELELVKLFAHWVGNELSRQRAHDELHRARDAAESANRAKSSFLAAMSHEIRTPMNGVLGMAQLLLMSELTNEQREHVETIRSSGDALLILLNDILDSSKIEAGKLQVEEVDFRLAQTVNEVVELLRHKAQGKRVSLRSEIAPHLPRHLRGDEGRIRQILINFVSNAIKFTREGEVRVEVTGTATGNRAKLRIAVHDTGIGISREAGSRLFQAFSQADASTTRRFGGTGLGLLITRQLAELMGGSVGMESEVGQGSTFWVSLTLPIADAVPSERLGMRSLRPMSFAARVLLAEDNVVNQKVASRMLEKLGCHVDVAGNGVEALSMFSKFQYHVVLMDCQMPEMDGYEASREIRRVETERALTRTPIVALTANAMPEDRRTCLAAGMDDFISKPVSARLLSDVVRRICGDSTAPAAG